jgi:Flp pilus assembly pilin Flp
VTNVIVTAVQGQALAEYALIIALVAVLAAATMFLLGTQVSQVLSIVGDALA